MTQEEKAKAYDKALEKARQLCAYPTTQPFISDLQDIFPELAESEDERIRKWIIGVLSTYEHDRDLRDAAIAWLERQCSQILANSAKTCKDEQKPTDFSDLRTWKYIVDAVWTEREGIGQYLDSPFTEEVAKKLQKRFGNIEQKPWSEEDEQAIEDAETWLDTLCDYLGDNSSEPTVKEVISKLESLKYRVQPKQEWSEEDERMLKELVRFIPLHLTSYSYKEYYNWAVSHRPQKQWKPTEEQMNALNDVISSRDIKYDVLSELWKDLKKLRKE